MQRLSLLIRLLLCALVTLAPLSGVDQYFYDRFFLWKPQEAPRTPIVLVTFNLYRWQAQLGSVGSENSHANLLWHCTDVIPWRSSVFVPLLKKIKEGNPSAIFLGFHSPDPVKDLSDEMAERVVFSGLFTNNKEFILTPSEGLSKKRVGFLNTFVDEDNVLRQHEWIYFSVPSLALEALKLFKGENHGKDLHRPFRINFKKFGRHLSTFDADEVLAPDFDPNLFSKHWVLVGLDDGSSGTVLTPLGRMSPLRIQAQLFENTLAMEEIRWVPSWISFLINIGILIAVSLIVLFSPLLYSWLWVALLFAIYFALSFVIFWKGLIFFGVANVAMTSLLTYWLIVGFRIRRELELQWNLEKESDYLRDLDQFKNNFISLFSHDLRTPIARIKAIVERLGHQENGTKEDFKEGLQLIGQSNAELERYISNILKVTRMESIKLEPKKEVLDLNRLVEGALDKLKYLADEKSILIVMDLEPLFSIEGDSQLILEVILNILENALKYGPKGSKITVTTREERNRVYLNVMDEGPGIPPEEIPRVTGKFFRGKEALKTKGSGLGLYLAKYFVEMSQGELSIESELGKGTKVGFYLPIT